MVFLTGSAATAFKLLERVSRTLLLPMTEVWLCPWGTEADRYEARFQTPVPEDGSRLDAVLGVAGRLCSSWTLELASAGDGAEGILFQGWTPAGYRRIVMEGLAESSFIVRDGTGLEHRVTPALDGAGVRQRVLRDGTVVNVVVRGAG